jgi:hypothetical protein
VACLEQTAFGEQVAAIRAGRETAYRLASLYSRRDSAGHLVMEYTLAAAVQGEAQDLWPSLALLLTQEVQLLPLERRLSLGKPRNQPGDKSFARWERGARLIARRGTDQCLVLGCEGKRYREITYGGPRDGSRKPPHHYCEEHFRGGDHKRDDRLIEDTFESAARIIRWSFQIVGPRQDER